MPHLEFATMELPGANAFEAARLAKLADYQILDTPPESAFDEITAAAAHLFKMPISLVSLIDRDRQWFKARYGLGPVQTPRSQAFCAHAIESDELLIVPDATADSRFSQNPLVTGDPNIRFYAGAPLITPDHFRLGTLCVIDTAAHEQTSEEQRAVLTMLARLVMSELENRRIARRAEHQATMATRLADALVALAQAETLETLAQVVADQGRKLCMAEIARVACLNRGVPTTVLSQRERAAETSPPLPWADLDQELAAYPPGHTFTTPGSAARLPSGGAWVGARLGRGAELTMTLQIWRRLTSSFTEMELAMLNDLARVASAMVDRLPAVL